MTIRFKCPHCEALLYVGEDAKGRTGKCPECESAVRVPDQS